MRLDFIHFPSGVLARSNSRNSLHRQVWPKKWPKKSTELALQSRQKQKRILRIPSVFSDSFRHDPTRRDLAFGLQLASIVLIGFQRPHADME